VAISKIKTAQELSAIRDAFDEDGRRLVFTNGCFDLLHVGHVRYLQAARALGDALVVAVNGDESVRSLKGPDRPINQEADRAEILASLACVDFVVPFQTSRVTDLVRMIRPHLYAKGGDYTIDSLDSDEVAALRKAGSEIQILPLIPNRSTTATLAKLSAPAPSS